MKNLELPKKMLRMQYIYIYGNYVLIVCDYCFPEMLGK